MQRDNLDFKNMSVSKLFTKQLFPTLLGMVSSALFTVVDGIFVVKREMQSINCSIRKKAACYRQKM